MHSLSTHIVSTKTIYPSHKGAILEIKFPFKIYVGYIDGYYV